MKINMSDFQKVHKSIYNIDSSGYAPFAFWKMEKLCQDAEAFYLPTFNCYYVIRNKHLLIYYSPDNQCHIPIEQLNSLDCISMKVSIFDTIKDNLGGFKVSYAECLHYNHEYNQPQINSDFTITEFDFTNEEHYCIAARIINQDEGDFLQASNIKKMMSFPTFDHKLWFFVQEKASKELIGIAISTFHTEVKETDLDWIYISPQHHGKGAGRLMLKEIINRSINRSNVIRVGGTVEFYKKCGFYCKEDHVWAAKPGYSFYAPSVQPNVLP